MGPAMVFRYLIITIIISGSLVSGCASPPPPVVGKFAWDGLGQDPNKRIRQHRLVKEPASAPDSNTERQSVLATLRPYSAEWVALYNQIEAEEDRRLKIKLVICHGCFPKLDADYTGSLRP